MDTTGIYVLTNKINGYTYVGQSININKRIQYHNSKSHSIISKAISLFGFDNFSINIHPCTKNELDEKEVFYINFYDSVEKGYNKSKGNVNKKYVEVKFEEVENEYKIIEEELKITKNKKPLLLKLTNLNKMKIFCDKCKREYFYLHYKQYHVEHNI